MLARYEPEPRSNLPAVAEVPLLAQGRNEGGGVDGADAWDLLEPAACLALAVPGGYLRFQLGDLLIERLQVLKQPVDEHAEGARQLVRPILGERGHALGNGTDALRDDESVFAPEPSDLVALGGACP